MPRRIAKPKPKCIDCGKVTYRVHPILDISLCADCRKRNEKYAYITKTRALQEYRLKPDALNLSQFVEGRRWWPRVREGLEGVRVFAGDGLCNGEKMVSFSASVDALQSVIN